MSACGEITIGSTYSCTNPLQGGARPNVRLINLNDIESVTYSETTPNLITAIVLKEGAKAYLFEGFGKSVTPQQEVIKLASGQNLYKHQVGLFIFDRTQSQKNNIQRLVLGQFVAIVEATKKDANAFEVFGLGNGLELVPGVINQLQENNGAYTIVLATPDGSAEALLPQTFFVTDFATTLAAIEELVNPTEDVE
jgi:hypothetical protein